MRRGPWHEALGEAVAGGARLKRMTGGKAGQAFYRNGTPVLLGDHVELRVWVKLFRKLPGTIVYVPGISKRRAEMEHGGLTWVGIRMDDDGTIVGSIINSDTQRLVKRVTLVRRGEAQEIPADVELEG
jgi:hypothetical protein